MVYNVHEYECILLYTLIANNNLHTQTHNKGIYIYIYRERELVICLCIFIIYMDWMHLQYPYI